MSVWGEPVNGELVCELCGNGPLIDAPEVAEMICTCCQIGHQYIDGRCFDCGRQA